MVDGQALRGARDLAPQIAIGHEIAISSGKLASDRNLRLIGHRLRVNASWTVRRLREWISSRVFCSWEGALWAFTGTRRILA